MGDYDKEFKVIFSKLDNLHSKLFEDNGGKCLQSRVNGNSQAIKIVAGIFAAIGTFILTIVGWIIKSRV